MNKISKIYIAGPMRGIPDWNFPAFDEAARRWRSRGWIVFSPADMDRALNYGPEHGESPEHLRHVISNDVTAILMADAIALLPGWEGSSGVTVELALAQFLSLPIYCAVTGNIINPVRKPWSTHAPQDPQRQHGLSHAGGWDSHGFDPDLAAL